MLLTAATPRYGRSTKKIMQRRLAAIVHADLAGFTRMMEGAETRTFRHLKSAQIEVWRPAIDAGRGRLVGTAGDAMLAEFGSAVTGRGRRHRHPGAHGAASTRH